MKQILTIIQIILSILLITAIMFQSQGQGLGLLGGSGGEFFKSKRGFEKILFRFTIICAIAFLLSLIAQLWLL